jgi:hypothetical protein
VDKPGVTKWFTESIFSSLADKIYSNLPYYNVEVFDTFAGDGTQLKLFKARYGAKCIGYSTTEEGAEQFQEWHKLIMKETQPEAVPRTNKIKIEREKVIYEIDEVLARFLVDGFVPGRCSGCPG